MKGLNRLLRFARDGHKPHPRLLPGAADGACIHGITLVRLHPRLHILWGNQPHLMAKFFQRARPIMGPAAGFHPHHGAGAVGKPGQHLFPSQLPAFYHLPRLVLHVHFKHILRNVDPNHGTLHLDSSFVLSAAPFLCWPAWHM